MVDQVGGRGRRRRVAAIPTPRHRRRARFLAAVVTAVSLTAAACGSTVPRTDVVAGDTDGIDQATPTIGGSEDEFGTPADRAGATRAPRRTAAGGSGTPGETTGDPTPGAPSGGTPEPTAGGADPAQAAGGDIKLGIQYVDQGESAANNIGVSRQAFSGDPQAPFRILIDDLNARGGIHGRKVVPVWSAWEPASGDSQAVQEQRTCTKWTQDDPVVAALIIHHHTETLVGCLNDAGVATIGQPVSGGDDDEVYRRFPYFAAAGTISPTRLGPVYIDALVEQGFFDAGSRIGLVVEDYPAGVRAAEQTWKPALARHGLELTEEARLGPIYGVDTFSRALGEAPNVVLRFNSRGVNRVILLEHGNGAMTFAFLTAARSQDYRPRYGLTTNNGPVPTVMENDFEDQMSGAVGLGWAPFADVVGTPPANSEQAKRCDDLMQRNGQPMDVEGIYWLPCDHFNVFVTAATAGGARVDAASVLAGLATMGRVDQASTLPLGYDAARRDGIAFVRHLAFFEECECFRYTSDPYGV